jgi:hypothetical protein
MSKYIRHQSVISRHADESIDENHWLKQFQNKLQKEAVQPKQVDRSLFDQITSIMNGKSKYTSVEAAVDDMKNRSGLTAYLDKVKVSESIDDNVTKVAEVNSYDDNNAKDKTPIVIQKKPIIANTIENIIRDSKGNLPVIAIIEKVKSIHHNDVSDDMAWDDDNLIMHISGLNLKAKQDNAQNNDNHNLGKADINNQSDIDPSNDDAFFALKPNTK